MALILDKTEQKIVDIIDAHRNEIIAFAKDIYTHAELGYKEYRTAEKFASFMKNLGLENECKSGSHRGTGCAPHPGT